MYIVKANNRRKGMKTIRSFDTLIKAVEYSKKKGIIAAKRGWNHIVYFVDQFFDKDDFEAAIVTIEEAVINNCESCKKVLHWAYKVRNYFARQFRINYITVGKLELI